METILIFLWVIAAFVCMAFWEAYVEGKYAWASRQCGWTLNIGKYKLTAYHFWMNLMFVFLGTLPLMIFGWDAALAGVLLSAFITGFIVEDFMWYVVNPKVPLKNFNPRNANWYPWTVIGKLKIPTFYIIGFLIAFASWILFWQ